MNVLVMGGLGNMGKRYCAILRHLGHTPIVVDPAYATTVEQVREPFHHAIVATPTPTHLDAIREINRYRDDVAILCEKPIAKDLYSLKLIFAECDGSGNSLYCVNQYNYLPEVIADEKLPIPLTWYHYFNHGQDGLAWDCFQMFALSKNGTVQLGEDSPVWDCGINGRELNLKDSQMDWAYVRMIEDFLGSKERVWGRDVVLRATERILAYQ